MLTMTSLWRALLRPYRLGTGGGLGDEVNICGHFHLELLAESHEIVVTGTSRVG